MFKKRLPSKQEWGWGPAPVKVILSIQDRFLLKNKVLVYQI